MLYMGMGVSSECLHFKYKHVPTLQESSQSINPERQSDFELKLLQQPSLSPNGPVYGSIPGPL